MGDFWAVKAVDGLSEPQVGEVVSVLGLSIDMVVSSLTVVTEAVKMLHAQVQALAT